MPRDNFSAPPMNRRVTVRNPGQRPAVQRDRYGAPVGDPPSWGVQVRAHRQDLTSRTVSEEGVQVEILRVNWTIRAGVLDRVDQHAEVVDRDGTVYGAIGVSERAGRGHSPRYLVIQTERRS